MSGDAENYHEMPGDVVDAIRRGRKIEAIKALREVQQLSLKQAKHAVEKYIRDNPSVAESYQASRPDSGIGRLLIIVIVLFALYYGFRWVSA